jgi:hypothetical protein
MSLVIGVGRIGYVVAKEQATIVIINPAKGVDYSSIINSEFNSFSNKKPDTSQAPH